MVNKSLAHKAQKAQKKAQNLAIFKNLKVKDTD